MTGTAPAWPAGAATGVGSLPGTDPREAARTVLGELPDLVPLPELPARGAHADLAGRGAALLAGLHVDLQPSGWRVVPRASRDGRLARDLLARDLDAMEEAADGAPPAVLKVGVTGPWTLAALLELTRGHRVLSDHGAVRDLTASLAEGAALLLADLARRLPTTALVLQVDEPSLPAVLAARIPTASGYGTLRAPDPATVRDQLRLVLDSSDVADSTVVHCCAPSPPVLLLTSAGADHLSLDATLLHPRDDDAVGEALEAGVGLLLGVVPGTDAALDLDHAVRPVSELWRRLGQDPGELSRRVVLTPSCGLAGASPGYARDVMAAVVEMGRRSREAPP